MGGCFYINIKAVMFLEQVNVLLSGKIGGKRDSY